MTSDILYHVNKPFVTILFIDMDTSYAQKCTTIAKLINTTFRRTVTSGNTGEGINKDGDTGLELYLKWFVYNKSEANLKQNKAKLGVITNE